MVSNSSHSLTQSESLEVLISADAIAERVRELGATISRDYADSHDLCVVGVLKGSFVFCADLVRAIDRHVTCEFIGISSYGDATQSSGVVKITSDLTQSIEGRDVLIVEDIIDTGLSISYLLDNFGTRRPRSVKVCSLLIKPDSMLAEVPVNYHGFEIPDRFVVGYGLDAAGRFRNLPYVGVYHDAAS